MKRAVVRYRETTRAHGFVIWPVVEVRWLPAPGAPGGTSNELARRPVAGYWAVKGDAVAFARSIGYTVIHRFQRAPRAGA